MALVYQHRTADTNQIFYIGIGTRKCRAKSSDNRNRHWHYVVRKHGINVEILFSGIDIEEAKQIEKYLIRFYGRKSEGGILVNHTDGGDGIFGHKMSDFAKARIKASSTGRLHTPEAKEKIRIAHLGTKMPAASIEKTRAANTGRKHTNKAKDAIRNAVIGRIVSENVRLVASKTHNGKIVSDETRKKLSISLTGRKLQQTEEAKNIRSAAIKKGWEIRRHNEIENAVDGVKKRSDAGKLSWVTRLKNNSLQKNIADDNQTSNSD
jgi:hypothetical protein